MLDRKLICWAVREIHELGLQELISQENYDLEKYYSSARIV